MMETPRSRTTAIAAGCAIALSALLGACASAASAGSPTAKSPTVGTTSTIATSASTTSTSATGPNTGSTATSASGSAASSPSATRAPVSTPTAASPPNSAPAPITAEFLRQSSLPDWPVYQWTAPQLWELNVEHPLPTVCDNALGTQLTHGVWEGVYHSANSQTMATEDIYAFDSASNAAKQMTLSTPKCDRVTVQTATSFAWLAPEAQGSVTHTLFVLQGTKIAALTLRMSSDHDYNPALDASLLAAMAQRLSGS
ncbi:hypothetical protein [Catenulispora pinisilvae]|uniref:hypothetical protein n=1 Tax=Catenulispora pinisilvae TaxID=2705253 RepID=UPI0018918A69|nr:hypothetical protein [Catenulispora pinisilvae]